jgi:acyl-CoA thioester hydrolase
MGSPVETEERVRYSETDQMGVAHNKSYFEWFEIGRTEFCRKKGIPYREIEAQGFYLVVVEAFCKYRKPLRYDQRILIRVTLREATPKKVVFDYEILALPDRSPVASGYTIHIATNARGEVRTLPEPILERITSE